MEMRNKRVQAAVLMVVAGMGLCSSARADVIWDNDSTDGLWATGANWSTGAVPAAQADVTFNDTGTGTSVTNAAVRSIGTLLFTRGTDFSILGTQQINVATGLTASGAGRLTVAANLNSIDNANSAVLNVTGALTAANMTFGSIAGTGNIRNSGRFQLWSGVAQTWQGIIGGTGSTGAIELSHRDAVLTLSGANGSYQNSSVGSINYGKIVLDNTVDNNADRWIGGTATGNLAMYGHAGLTLKGNGTSGTTEQFGAYARTHGNNTIEVQSNGGQLAKLTFHRIDNGSGGGFANYVGNDLGGTSRIVYTAPTVDFLADGIIGGFSRVGNEFATHDIVTPANRVGVTALSSVGRPGQVQGGTGTQNVLVNSTQNVVTSNNQINSLKVDGAHAIDLGGFDLTIDTGGIIQTGAAGSITNGTIKTPNNSIAAPGGWLSITTASDLNIGANIRANSASTVTTENRGIAKNGAGKLTLSGNLATGAAGTEGTFVLNWYEGSVDIQSNSNVALRGYTIGNGSLIKGGNGTANFTNTGNANTFPNSFSGGVTVQAGKLISNGYTADRNLGTGRIRVDQGASLYLQTGTNTTSATASDAILGNDFSGSGTIFVRGRDVDANGTGQTVKALRSQGAEWSPGNSAGILTVNGNLALEKSGADFSVLKIDITGSGAQAGIDYDQLAVTGTFSGLNANASLSTVDLVVDISPSLDLTGDVFTILTTSSNLSTVQFHNVSFGDDVTGTLSYNNGSITLSGLVAVPEPGVASLLAASSMLLGLRRRRFA